MSKIFGTTNISNPLERYKSRLTLLEENEKGFRFRREHPMHKGEEFFMGRKQFLGSSWVEISEPRTYSAFYLYRVKKVDKVAS